MLKKYIYKSLNSDLMLNKKMLMFGKWKKTLEHIQRAAVVEQIETDVFHPVLIKTLSL